MGYASIRIPATRTPVPEWITELSERDFQERIARDMRVITQNRAPRAAYGQVFAAYFRDAASDGLRDGTWRYEGGAFHFSFPDHGGSAMSAAASIHFVELGAAILSERQPQGWQLKPERSLLEVLNHNEQPLVELGKTLYVLGKYRRDFTLTTDDSLPPKEWSELDRKDQSRLEAMWKSKTCGCQVCEYYRPRAAKAKTKAKAKAKTKAR